MSAGYADTAIWSEKVGRSTRMLLGLERGEQVGPRTLALIEGVLQKQPGWAHRYLAGEDDPIGGAHGSITLGGSVGPPSNDAGYVEDRGHDDRSPGITDDELLSELRQIRQEVDERFDDLERRLRDRSVEGPR